MINSELPLLPNRWQCYIGIFVESTKSKNQRTFKFYVPEFLPEVEGDVQPVTEPEQVTMNNAWNHPPIHTDNGPNQLDHQPDEITANVAKWITADYFGIDATYTDVPDVYRGMQALLFNFGNVDKWYWIPLERDREYKTFEHVRISANNEAVSNKSGDIKRDKVAERNAKLTDDNQYWLEIDTRYKKGVRLHTSSSDGEKFEYDFYIDTTSNIVEIHDKCVDGSQPNNSIRLESKPGDLKGRITVQNAAGCSLILQDQDMMINVPRNLSVNVGADCLVNVDGNVVSMTKKDSHHTVVGNFSSLINGLVNRKFMSDVSSYVMANLYTIIVGTHTESQNARICTAEAMSVICKQALNVSTATLTVLAKVHSLSAETATYIFKNLITYAKEWTTVIGQHTMSVISKMLYYLPFNVKVPKVPLSTHTMYM